MWAALGRAARLCMVVGHTVLPLACLACSALWPAAYRRQPYLAAWLQHLALLVGHQFVDIRKAMEGSLPLLERGPIQGTLAWLCIFLCLNGVNISLVVSGGRLSGVLQGRRLQHRSLVPAWLHRCCCGWLTVCALMPTRMEQFLLAFQLPPIAMAASSLALAAGIANMNSRVCSSTFLQVCQAAWVTCNAHCVSASTGPPALFPGSPTAPCSTQSPPGGLSCSTACLSP